jgi:pyrimidine operon attenuation protein/uracil phosphoribosyltransferase
MDNSIILKHEQILTKLERMSWQILENNFHQSEIVLLGLKESGLVIANAIANTLQAIYDGRVICTGLTVDKKNPRVKDLEMDEEVSLEGRAVILVDDVLNSGRTLAYAVASVLKQDPAKVETAILANRDHHHFPVQVTFEGISLATTLQEHLTFSMSETGEMTVMLD